MIGRTAVVAGLSLAMLPIATDWVPGADAAGGPIAGSLFVDLDRDGVFDVGEHLDPTDPLYPPGGITVDAYDPAGGSTSCAITGNTYNCDVAALVGTEFRLEFGLSAGDQAAGFSETRLGDDSQSSVQFVDAGTVADFGVTPPSQCPLTGVGFGGNPNSPSGKVFTTCFVNGDRDQIGPQEAFVGLNFDTSGGVEKIGLKGNQDEATTTSAELGALWGVAYDEWRSTIFTSAVMRRHVDLGAEGIDGVYWLSYPSGSWNSVSLGDIAGAPSYGTEPVRDIEGKTPFQPFYDVEAYAAVGRVGIGDIDLTPDGRTLLVSNLAQRSVDIYDVAGAADGIAPTFLRSVAVGNPGCAGDANAFQVWALSASDSDSAAVGVACTGVGAPNIPADLAGHIVPIDVAAGTAGASLLTIPLGYAKSCAANFASCPTGDNYRAWTDEILKSPQALIGDIDVTSDGSMVIGILDRNSLQRSHDNYLPDPAGLNTQLDYAVSNGDLLHVCNTSGDPENPAWVLEGAGVAGCDASANFPDATGANPNTVQAHFGVGGLAEWYGDDRLINQPVPTNGHAETAWGGLWVNPNSNEVVAASMAPESFDSGGLQWYDTNSGAETNAKTLYTGKIDEGFSGKAAGLGDVEGCSIPVEIGDFVWLDLNRNGVQDPGETPLADVTVMLLDVDGNAVATTTTNVDGRYAFGSTDGLLAETGYSIMFDVTTTSTLLPSGFTPADLSETAANAVANDQIDSDVADGKIAITSPVSGTNDHSFDAGYTLPILDYRIGSLVWQEVDNDGLAEPGETPLPGITVELLTAAGAVLQTTTTDDAGEYAFSGLAAGTYRVRVPGGQGALDGLRSAGFPLPNADGGTDNDNNGVVTGADFTSGEVLLGDGNGVDEPVGEGNGITGLTNEDGTFPDNRSNQTVDFGFSPVPPMELGDQLWFDADNSGTLDAGEEFAPAGVTVNLLDENGVFVRSTTTAAGGTYLFDDLSPGKFIVEIPASELADGGLLEDYGPSTGPGVSDDPEDGVEDNSDGALAGGGAIRSGVVMLVTDGEPTDDLPPSGEVNDENSNLTVDFGLLLNEVLPAPVLSLGDTIWLDADNSGTFDAGESTAPAGVVVDLLDEFGGVIMSVTTDANGEYLFGGLEPGDYVVSLPPENFDIGGPVEGFMSSTGNGATAPDPDNDIDNDDNGNQARLGVRSGGVTLSEGGEPAGDGNFNPSVDFGLIPAGAIGLFVFEDLDANGQFGGLDLPVPNVVVNLLESNGSTAATTITDGNGKYLFSLLPAGDYIVEFIAPPGRTFTLQNRGDDSTDSDPDRTSGRTAVISLALGQDILDIDAGITPVVLPRTGGAGTLRLAPTGLAIALVGLLILLGTRRRRPLRVW